MNAFTYAEVGATARPDNLPVGYHHVKRRERVGSGRAHFDALVRRLMSWGIQRGAGLQVNASGDCPNPGVDVTTTIAVGPMRFRAPCRVVWTLEEPRRTGFAYGTLPGHPSRGEEAFVAEFDSAETVWFTITAFSRPGTWYAKLGGPVTSRLQALVTDRYIAAARRPPD